MICRYLVSCEGAHSRVRQWCGIAFEGATYPHDFVMADVTIDTTRPHASGYSFLHPDGVVAMIALPAPGTWRLFLEAGSARVEQVTLDVVRRMYAERSGDRASVLRDPTWLTRFKIHARVVDRFRCGRVFLAGDAAHLHSPSGGQGIVTGMQDATNLAFKLAQVLQHGAPDALLDTDHEERHPAARRVLDTTDRNTRMLFARGPAAKWLRNHVIMPLFGLPPVQQHILGHLSQLQVHYRDASLARAIPCWRASGVKSGERAPDVVLDAGEHRTTLFTLLGRGCVVALLGRANRPLEASLRRLGMTVHPLVGRVARRLYGGSPEELCLIRPDGFVLARCDVAARTQWLRILRQLWSEEELDAACGSAAAESGRRWAPA
jgi:4,5-epoxidase